MNIARTQNQNKEVMLFAKALSIMAVVLVHMLAFFPETIYTESDYKLLFVGLNQLLRFSVPLFLALSGFGLSQKYGGKSISIKKFMVGRFRKLLPLYVLWSVILIMVFRLSGYWEQSQGNLWQTIVFGKADYHLYFVPLIFQLYLLFTLLPKLKTLKQFLGLVAVTVLVQVGWFSFIRIISGQETNAVNKLLLDDQVQYRLLHNWLFYFMFGVLFSQINLGWVRSKRLVKYVLGVVIGVGLVWSVIDAQMLIRDTGNLIYATSFIRLPVLVYATGVITAVLVFGESIFKFRAMRWKGWQVIGIYSYVIYLSHTLGLRVIEGMLSNHMGEPSLVMAGILLVVGTVVSNKFLLA